MKKNLVAEVFLWRRKNRLDKGKWFSPYIKFTHLGKGIVQVNREPPIQNKVCQETGKKKPRKKGASSRMIIPGGSALAAIQGI